MQFSITEVIDNESFSFIIPHKYIGVRLDIALAEIITDLSRSKISNWLKDGAILVDQTMVKPNTKLTGRENITITPPFSLAEESFKGENIPLNIVYSDSEIIIINKPHGLVVHPGAGNHTGTLLNALLYHYPELINIPRAGIVHRLDKDTSGLMVIARTLNAQISLIEQLQKRQVKRVYRALVDGHPLKEEIINKNIGRDPNNRIKMTTLEFGGREAITRYRLLKQYAKIAYVECNLQTGRTHQIRVHMRYKGYPLIGDQLYGKKKLSYDSHILFAIEALNRQALHAINLSFIHPKTQELMQFKTKLPEDFKALLHSLEYNDDHSNSDLIEEDYNEDDNQEGWEIIYTKE